MFSSFLGLELWKFFSLFALLIFGFLFFLILKKILRSYFLRVLDKFKYTAIINKYLGKVVGQITFLITIWILYSLTALLELPDALVDSIDFSIKIILPLIVTVIAYRLSDLFTDIFSKVASKTETTVDDKLVPLIGKALKFIVIILGSFYIIESLGIDYTPLLAATSVGGLALALAAQDTFKNLFGSITIFSDKPFDVGDWIMFDGVEGTVEEVGVRSTRVRTFYNSLISIPNGRISDMLVDNMGRRRFRRYKTMISITYDTPPDLIESYILGLNKLVDVHPTTRKDYHEIYLNNFADSSLDILVYIFFEVKDWSEELKSRQEFMLGAIKLAQHLGIRFAFPSQTLHIEEFPDKKSLTPEHNSSKEEYDNKLNMFFNKINKKKNN
jgi:MscS family membrane protein